MATVEDSYNLRYTFSKERNILWRKITITFRLKVKQMTCLYDLLFGRDVLAILPTGFGKSIIFHLLPDFLSLKNKNNIVIVVSPLNSCAKD